MPNPYAEGMKSNLGNLIGRQQERAIARQTKQVDGAILVPLASIRIDPKAQIRADGLEEERVEEYTQAMIGYGGWGRFPALEVIEANGRYVIADGAHRLMAAEEANRITEELTGDVLIANVPVIVRPGGLNEAMIYGAENNLKNGQPLSRKDKQRYLALRLHPDTPDHLSWRGLSSNAIAPLLGVADTTVTRWKEKLGLATSANAEVRGVDGRTYRTSKITRARKEAAEDPQLLERRRIVRDLDKLLERIGKSGDAADVLLNLGTHAQKLYKRWGIKPRQK